MLLSFIEEHEHNATDKFYHILMNWWMFYVPERYYTKENENKPRKYDNKKPNQSKKWGKGRKPLLHGPILAVNPEVMIILCVHQE